MLSSFPLLLGALIYLACHVEGKRQDKQIFIPEY